MTSTLLYFYLPYHFDHVTLCSVRWLRLLQHCLTISPLQELPQNLMSVAAQAPGLLATCSALLTIPQGYPYRADIESILLRLGLSSSQVGLTILDMLLRNCFPAPSRGKTLSEVSCFIWVTLADDKVPVIPYL